MGCAAVLHPSLLHLGLLDFLAGAGFFTGTAVSVEGVGADVAFVLPSMAWLSCIGDPLRTGGESCSVADSCSCS